MDSKKRNLKYSGALKISVIYLIFSSIYIFLSDKIILDFMGDSASVILLNNIQTYKGLAFVIITSAIIFVLIQTEINSKRKYIKTLVLQNKKLEESEYKYSNLFYSMEQGVTYRNDKGEIIDANPSAQRILGLTLDQMQGKTSIDASWKCIHEDGSEFPGETHASMVALKTGEKVEDVIMGVFNPIDQDYRWIKIDAIPRFRKGDLKPYQVFTTFDDITLLKQGEEKIKISEEKFRTLAEKSPYGIFLDDKNGNAIYINERCADIVGLPLDRALDLDWFPSIHTDDRETVAFKWANAVKNGIPFNEEFRWVHTDGKVVWSQGAIEPVFDDNGNVTLFIGTLIDITERKLAETATKKQTYLLAKAQEIGNIGTWEFDIKKNVITWTQENYRIFGVDEETPLTYELFLSTIYPEDRDFVDKAWNEGVKSNNYDIEHRIIVNDEVRWVREKSQFSYDDSGQPIKAIGLSQDITSYKALTKELKENEEKFRNIFENSVVGKSMTLIDGTLKVNRAFSEIVGHSEKELNKISWQSITHPGDIEFSEQKINDILSGKTDSARWEKRYIRKNGNVVWVDISTILQKDANDNPLYYISAIYDITERKKAEQELKRQSEFINTMIENQPAGIVVCDADGKLVLFNKVAKQWHGIDAMKISQEEWAEYYNLYQPDGIKLLKQQDIPLVKAIKGEKVVNVEIIIRAEGQKPRIVNCNGASFTDAQGLNFGAVIVMTDITQERITKNNLKKSESDLRIALTEVERSEFLLNEAGRIAKIGAWEFDLATQKTRWSDQVFELHAIPVGEVPDFDFIMGCYIEGSEEILRKSVEECITERKIYELELRFLNARNEKLWVRAIGYPIINDKDEIISIRGVVQDITELKESILNLKANEKSLKKAIIQLERSELLFNETGKLAKVGGWQIDLTTMTPYFSEETYRIYDIPKGIPPKIEDGINFYAPEDRPIIQKAVSDAIEKQKSYDIEVPFITAKGKNIWVRTLGRVQTKNGKPSRMYGVIQDITLKRQAEESKRKSEERFRVAQEFSPDGFTILHPVRNDKNEIIDFIWIYENETIARINGTNPDQVKGKSLLDIFPDHKGSSLFQTYTDVANSGKPKIIEEINAGNVLSATTWLRLVTVPMEEDIAILAQDITARKIAEEELKSSEKRFRAMIEGAPDPIFIQTNKCFAYLNKHAVNLFGAKDEKELIGKPVLDFFHPDFHKTALERIKKLNEDKTIVQEPFEQILIKLNGKEVWVETKGEPLVFNNEIGGLVFVRDISYRKNAEKELQDSKNKLTELLNSLESGVVVHAPDTSITYHNQRAAKILRVRYDELTGKQVFDYPWNFLHEDGSILSLEEYPISQILTRKEGIQNMVIGMTHSEDTVWTLLNGFPILNEKNDIIEVVISFIEITEQVVANTKIKESEAKYKLLADNITDVISLHGSDAKYEYVSPSIRNVRGYEPEELLGKSPYDFIHSDDIEEVTSDVHVKRLEKGLSTEMVYRFKYKDGHYGWFESNRQPILDKNKKVIKIVSSSRDITDRIRKEEEIENYQKSLQNMTTEISRIEEKQRKEIAANIHDHLSQSLVISKIKLTDLQKEVKNSNSKKELNQVIKHITDALENSRKITYDLSPPVLYELGIVETMYWMTEKIEEEHNLKAVFSTDLDYLDLPESKLIFLYRIIQELVNNTIKHAHAKKINISLTKEKEGIQIILSDDGKGFDIKSLNETREKNTGFGLFAVKERIKNLGGNVTISSKIGIGTEILIYVPLKIN